MRRALADHGWSCYFEPHERELGYDIRITGMQEFHRDGLYLLGDDCHCNVCDPHYIAVWSDAGPTTIVEEADGRIWSPLPGYITIINNRIDRHAAAESVLTRKFIRAYDVRPK